MVKHRLSPFLLIPGVLLHLAGCGNDRDQAADDGQPRLISNIREIKTPFQGTVRAQQWIHTPSNSADITYTIRHDRIRRDVISTHPVLQTLSEIERRTGTTQSRHRSGVICHPAEDEVLLYCSDLSKKRFCQLTLSEYRDLCTQQTFGSPGFHYSFGLIFAGVPPGPERITESFDDAVTIEGLTCDRLVINFGSATLITIVEADHCETIQVDRKLLRLVEVNLPSEVTGFPLRVRRAAGIRQLRQAKPHADTRLNRLIDRVADGIEKTMESGLKVVEINSGVPEESAFRLPAEFSEVAGIAEFEAAFSAPPGDSDDDDDDD